MGTYAEYLSQLHAYWINLDVSTDRAERWLTDNKEVFASVTRISAMHYDEVSDETLERFVEMWRANLKIKIPQYKKLGYNTYILTKSEPVETYRRHSRRTELAVVVSHCRALHTGLRAGHERFIVAEDDASPRATLWSDETQVPPIGDVIIHGGGISLAAHQTDNRWYLDGQPHRWRKVTQPFNSLCATTYEVTRRGAEALLQAVNENPMAYDQAWGFALVKVPSYVVTPTVFSQVGRSIRNGIMRTPPLDRDT